MAKYVDLAQTGSGHGGTETPGDAYSWTEFKTSVNGTNSETYYIKGEKDVGADWLTYGAGSVALQFLPWDFSTNGPFRLKCSLTGDSHLMTGTWSNAIIENTGLSNSMIYLGYHGDDTVLFRSSYIKTIFGSSTGDNKGFVYYSSSCTFEGCTIIGSLEAATGSSSLVFKDSIVNVSFKDSTPP